jgi:hypothetical protein
MFGASATEPSQHELPGLRGADGCCRTRAEAALHAERARVLSTLDRCHGGGKSLTPHVAQLRAATVQASSEADLCALRILSTHAANNAGVLVLPAYAARLAALRRPAAIAPK